ncbi:hypothetical protein P3102_01710 [Amycolatopsis sp. QT-25]|uniref:hypothetical protein n=1 Tax=Amycolatopsis sp. QT-25 TaxID=3034022 RepID=UPI0023EBF102|nr:hypothetical protein [Amycolatopsis sp. QT-25]WET79997.1 hypothetical protein P3102_01710 [Amycolatopsis sp. QT-25]HET6288831.1 hypothetical protein [Amycolatopsis sp.]
MSDDLAGDSLDERYGLTVVRDLEEYAEALSRLVEQGLQDGRAPLLSAAEAYAAAELLGRFALDEPWSALNQLAATLASRIYTRLGA